MKIHKKPYIDVYSKSKKNPDLKPRDKFGRILSTRVQLDTIPQIIFYKQ